MKLLKTVSSQSKLPLISIAIALVVGVSVIQARNNRTELILTGLGLNAELSEQGVSWIREELSPLLGTGDGEEAAYASASMGSFTNSVTTEDYYLLKNIQNLCHSDSLDYFLLDKTAMENLIRQDIFLDLTDFFSEAELADLEEYLIWAVETPQEEGAKPDLEARRPVAVRVDGLPFFRDNCPEGARYFAISSQSTRLEQCRILWDRLLSWR